MFSNFRSFTTRLWLHYSFGCFAFDKSADVEISAAGGAGVNHELFLTDLRPVGLRLWASSVSDVSMSSVGFSGRCSLTPSEKNGLLGEVFFVKVG